MSEIKENSIQELIAKGQNLYSQQKYKEALAVFKTALVMPKKQDNNLLMNLYIHIANTCYKLHDVEQYANYYEGYLKYNPTGQPAVFSRLAQAYSTIDIDKSIDYRNKSLNLNISEYDIFCKLFAMTKSSFYSQEEIRSEAEYEIEQIKSNHYKNIKKFDFSKRLKDKNRKLNVAYLSSDCHTHVMMNYIVPLWENHNKEKYNFTIFSCSEKEDVTTKRIQNTGIKFVQCKQMNNETLAQTIYDNEIDILVDIGGFTQMKSLVNLYKPAPIIISYLGYLNTMGMKEVDYILADKFMIPENKQELYSEKVLYLNKQYQIFDKKTNLPEITPVPFETNGYITFGSFNCTSKMSYTILFLWSEILKRCPNSKLLIYRTQMTKKHILTLREKFRNFGIDDDRVIFNTTSTSPHYVAYSFADIALDTFPFSGMSITKECAFMGVPTITLNSEGLQSRGSSNVNFVLGLEEFNTTCGDDYIKCAIDLAQNRDKIRSLRTSLRDKMLNSAICQDYKEFALDVENAFETAWKKFIGSIT